MARFKRILLTGANGNLGKVLRTALRGLAEIVRVSDREPLSCEDPKEEIVACDLADGKAVTELTRNVDAIVHMGGFSKEGPFEALLAANIQGFYNLFDAARRSGVKRVVWGSSNHAIGFYDRTTVIDSTCPTRPDSLYGVSKVFGEAVAQLYYEKFALETVSMRIGSCFPKPVDRRMLSTWLSYRDLIHLVDRSLSAPRVGHLIVYGVSANDELLWSNVHASFLGYRPQDNAESYRGEIEGMTSPPSAVERAIRFHGGHFAGPGHFED